MQGFSRVRWQSLGKKLLIILKLNDVVVDVDVEGPGVDTITSSMNALMAFLLIRYACADQ